MTKPSEGRVIEGGAVTMTPVKVASTINEDIFYEHDGTLYCFKVLQSGEQLRAFHYNQMAALLVQIHDNLQELKQRS